eukprot:1138521-Pelagomonas_calceolata.AAC.1
MQNVSFQIKLPCAPELLTEKGGESEPAGAWQTTHQTLTTSFSWLCLAAGSLLVSARPLSIFGETLASLLQPYMQAQIAWFFPHVSFQGGVTEQPTHHVHVSLQQHKQGVGHWVPASKLQLEQKMESIGGTA